MRPLEFKTVDTPSEDERFTPAYRRERHANAKPRQASFGSDGTRTEIRQYVTEPGHANDACAAVDQVLPNGWVARWVFAEQGGSMAVRSLTIEPEGRVTPTGGLVANTLRQAEVSPAKVTAHVNAKATEADRTAERNPDDLSHDALRLVVHRGLARWRSPEPEPPAPGRGRPALPDDFLAAVAIAYIEECAAGRGVLKRVGVRVGPLRGMRPRQVLLQTVKDWVRLARDRGFLTPATKQGSRGGQPGPRLLAYLDTQQNGASNVDNDN